MVLGLGVVSFVHYILEEENVVARRPLSVCWDFHALSQIF